MSVKGITRSILALALFAGLLANANAQQNGNPREGRRLSHQLCAQCHAVEQKGYSIDPAAPTFQEIAKIPGMTSTALTIALRTSHQSMPNLIIKGRDTHDIIAYILSLKNTR
jgi:mono/diheme cytochrome c family protein